MRISKHLRIYYPIGKPTLTDVIKLRLYEMGFTQSKLAEMLGVSNACFGETVNGKCEPSWKIGREPHRQLNIDSAVVLGV